MSQKSVSIVSLQENRQFLNACHPYRNEDRVADLLSISLLPGVEPGYQEVGPATGLLVPVHPTASHAIRQTTVCLGFPVYPGVPGPTIFTP